MKPTLRLAILLSLVSTSHLTAKELPAKLDVELVEPIYKNGALSTTKGGIIKGDDFYLQGRKISYLHRQEKSKDGKVTKSIHKILAEGDLFFLFKGRAYTGDRIEIDADTKETTIINGCTSMEPWFVGGNLIELKADGSGTIHNGYMTTSENEKSDWSMQSSEVKLMKGSKMKAKNVRFMFVKLPILWLPTYSTDLKGNHSSPIKYRVRFGGGLGPRVGVSYELFHTKNWNTDLLIDVLLRKGLGGGFTTRYENPNEKEKLFLFNYIAHDLRSDEEHKWLRYRFRGEYDNSFFQDKVQFRTTYDKLSDQDMKADYMNQGINSTRIYPAEARFSHNNPNWITSLNTKVRINNFQTIKQELPLFQFSQRPLTLGHGRFSPILATRFNAGYIDFKYAEQSVHVHDYHSTRVELTQKLYREIPVGWLSITPEAGYTAIAYNNSPQHVARNVFVAKGGLEAHTRFERRFETGRTAVEPYLNYEYFTQPSAAPHQHYLFDIYDGWHRLNTMRFGLRQFTTILDSDENFLKHFTCDLYTRAFFDTPTISRTIPRVYGNFRWKASPMSSYFVNAAWNMQRRYIDYVNVGTEMTLSEDAAFTLEYRTRSHYAWRKLDQENFLIDTFHSERRLRHSPLSDRRDAIVAGLFLRLNPTLSAELKTVQGFHRPHGRPYQAYEIEIITIIRGALKVSLSMQRQAKDWRWSINFDLGPDKPHQRAAHRIGEMNYNN